MCDAHNEGRCLGAPPFPLYGVFWEVCPNDAIADRGFRRLLRLLRAAEIAPLSNWPDGYTSAVVDGLLLLAAARPVAGAK